jgi:hypothetical protein
MRKDIMSEFAAESFLNLNDDQTTRLLREMNINDFIRLDPKFGKLLFQCLSEHERKLKCDILWPIYLLKLF